MSSDKANPSATKQRVERALLRETDEPIGARILGRPLREPDDLEQVINTVCSAYGLNEQHVLTELKKAGHLREFLLRLLGVHGTLKRGKGRPRNPDEDERFFSTVRAVLERDPKPDHPYEMAAKNLAELDPPIRGKGGATLSVKSVQRRFARLSNDQEWQINRWFDPILDAPDVTQANPFAPSAEVNGH